MSQSGVNEELGATAVWGTPQRDSYPQTNKFDGVFGVWYGKGPGVDRCPGVFKHANMAGAAKQGGIIAISHAFAHCVKATNPQRLGGPGTGRACLHERGQADQEDP